MMPRILPRVRDVAVAILLLLGLCISPSCNQAKDASDGSNKVSVLVWPDQTNSARIVDAHWDDNCGLTLTTAGKPEEGTELSLVVYWGDVIVNEKPGKSRVLDVRGLGNCYSGPVLSYSGKALTQKMAAFRIFWPVSSPDKPVVLEMVVTVLDFGQSRHKVDLQLPRVADLPPENWVSGENWFRPGKPKPLFVCLTKACFSESYSPKSREDWETLLREIR